MTIRIFLWLDYGLLHFGIAKQLQEKNFEIFAMSDTNKSLKSFFEKQKLVKFSKLWHLYDHIFIGKPDLHYLKNFEEKYGINIWDIAYIDRYFYKKFNKYHHFKYDEILSLIEQECKLFENIIDEIKPSVIFMNTITHHHQYLFYKICMHLGIVVLSLEPLRFGNKWFIVKGTIYDLLDIKNHDNINYKKTITEIQNFIMANKPAKFFIDKPKIKYKTSKWQKLKALLEFLFFPSFSYNQKPYTYYGRTRFNVIVKGTSKLHLIKQKYREYFIHKNFSYQADDKIPFIYFPLHLEPERVLFMGAPFYTNQLSIIANIAKSLPIGYKLCVKEHPAMKQEGWRPKSFYKEILELPNVELIHPSLTSEEIIKKSSLVISIRGTASIEAAYYGKPSIVFKADIGHTTIPSVHILEKIEDLPSVIRSALKKNTSPIELSTYVNFIEKNSFEFTSEKYSEELANKFNYNVGFLKQAEIQEEQVELFLHEFKDLYAKLTDEYVKKMNEYLKLK